MLVPPAGHLFRLTLFALFLTLLGARIGVELLDSNRKTERARDALDSTPEPKPAKATRVQRGHEKLLPENIDAS